MKKTLDPNKDRIKEEPENDDDGIQNKDLPSNDSKVTSLKQNISSEGMISQRKT